MTKMMTTKEKRKREEQEKHMEKQKVWHSRGRFGSSSVV